ncbi:MAG: hypothetical protein LBK07_03675 [Tannerella sp.]|nr:hypothetical protein [Tannerella sp.]
MLSYEPGHVGIVNGKEVTFRYYIWHYSDGHTPNASAENSAPVGSANNGGFDVAVHIPADSIAGGSFVVNLPDGFTLDQPNTKPAADFSSFNLTATKRDGNAWLLELKPKSARSAALFAEEASKTLAHLAYTVDGKVKRGTYDITLDNILFTTPDGNTVPEPAITVPVAVERWGAGNETVDVAGTPAIRTSGGNLLVRTDRPATLEVYTFTGQLFLRQTVGAGETSLPLPPGAYAVKLGDATAKVAVR